MVASSKWIDPEEANVIVLPYFDAVRDTFAEFEPEPGRPLAQCANVRFEIDERFHDTDRHYAACRDDGRRIYLAPQVLFLKQETLVAILAHEFGHATDFLYPGHWQTPLEGPARARWLGDPASGWRRKWEERNGDQVEWAADGIAEAVTGKKIGYCGRCLVQCFSGIPRPKGLR